MNMYTSVDLSALRGKKPFTGRSGGQAHLPDRWTILLGISYLLGILLGTKAMELAPENLQSGMLTIFSEHLAARTSQTLQQAVLSAFWQAAVPLTLLFLLGFCALALPLFPAVLLFEGMGYGVSVSAMLEYTTQNGISVFMGILFLAPFILCCALIWVRFGAEAMKLSLQCWKILCAGNTGEPLALSQYCRKCFCSLGAAVLLAAANGVWVQLLASRMG